MIIACDVKDVRFLSYYESKINYIQLRICSHIIIIFINKRKHKAPGNGKITLVEKW